MSDDYEPAIEMPTEQPAAPAAEQPVAAAARLGADGVEGQLVDSTDEPRGQRVISDKTRAMFRDLTAKIKSGEVAIGADDLVPMTHEPAAAAPAVPAAPAQPAARPLVPGTASPAAQAAAALPTLATLLARAPAQSAAPVQPASAKPSAHEVQRLQDIEARERKLAEREAAIAERDKQQAPRGRLVDAPAQTLADYVKAEYGISDPEDLKATLRDLMTEVGVAHLGVTLPDDVKAGLEGRNALRKVRAYSSDIDRKLAESTARETEAQKTSREVQERTAVQEQDRQAAASIASLVGQVADFPLLREHGEYGASIVWEAMKSLHDQGLSSTWHEAAKLVEDHLRSEADTLVKRAARFQSLLAPAASGAPAQPAVSPGGVPGPAPTQPALAAARTQPTVSPQPPADDEIVGEDRRERRHRELRALATKRGFGQQSR